MPGNKDEVHIKILDTNIWLADPEKALSVFHPKNEYTTTYILIPGIVLEESDDFKSHQGEVGYNSRRTGRMLRQLLRNSPESSYLQGIKIAPNYFIRIVTGFEDEISDYFTKAEAEVRTVFRSPERGKVKMDNIILAYALAYERFAKAQKKQKWEIELVTQDNYLIVKASAFGITANEWEAIRVLKSGVDFYKGYSDITTLKPEGYNRIYSAVMDKKSVNFSLDDICVASCFPNQFFRVVNPENTLESLLGRNDPFDDNVYFFAVCEWAENEQQTIHPVYQNKYPVKGIQPRNYQQAFALEALLDERIKLVTLIGRAGTGKTLLTLAASFHQLDMDQKLRLLITKPIVPVGNTLGFLPGTSDEKLAPWMQCIFDNAMLFKEGQYMQEYIRTGQITLQPLEHVRGRSIHKGLYILEEAQNLIPKEAKTVITREADTSRIILLGDTEQIDHPHLNEHTNGLLYASERMKASKLSATVYLTKGERGQLAAEAAELL
ncbi:PhoH family protein [Candidatus Woesearchaeota archaeon]|nr:PhoH family protein [Candidatus Woesearchaeota archaeon]